MAQHMLLIKDYVFILCEKYYVSYCTVLSQQWVFLAFILKLWTTCFVKEFPYIQ